MALTDTDRLLLQQCLAKAPGAWNDFVDRFLGLIYHVVHYTAHLRSVPIQPEDVEDIAAEVLLQIVADDYAVLRQFRMKSSLATYLTVIARRICIHELTRRANAAPPSSRSEIRVDKELADRREREPGEELENKEELDRLLGKLPARERQLARLRFMEGRSYEEISATMKVPVHTLGPLLTRLKRKLHELRTEQAQGPTKSKRTAAVATAKPAAPAKASAAAPAAAPAAAAPAAESAPPASSPPDDAELKATKLAAPVPPPEGEHPVKPDATGAANPPVQ
jgi:RNA polymerase sigma-70 factor (ECF subfamily)